MVDASTGIGDLWATELERDRRIARATFVALLVPTLWFLRTDFVVAARDAALLNERMVTRLAFALVLLGATWALRHVPDRPTYERRVLWASLAAAVCIVALNAMRPAGSTLPLRTPLMWLLAFYAGLVNRPVYQVLPPLLISACLIALRLTWVDSGASGTIDGDILVILVMNAIGLLVVRHRTETEHRGHRIWQDEREARAALERTLAELRQLRGIIPICAHCKSIRTTVGDWQAIEAYVRAHTDAQFSHGICPDCLAKHYTD